MTSRFLDLAIQAAMTNKEPKWKLAALTVGGGRILSVGYNSTMQNPTPTGTIPHTCLGRHAETEAIRFCHSVPKTIYIARVSKSFKPRLARPCNECYDAIRRKGIKRIVYTIDSTTAGTEKVVSYERARDFRFSQASDPCGPEYGSS